MGHLIKSVIMQTALSFNNKIIVVKIGGNSIAEDQSFLGAMAQQLYEIQAAGAVVVVVHGGGPQIDGALRAAGITPAKGADGRRLTDAVTMDVVARTMRKISLDVSEALQATGCRIAIPSQTPVLAEPLTQDGDRTGKVVAVMLEELQEVLQVGQSGVIVVLNSVGLGQDGLAYNINADDYALAVAVALKAERLILVTNVMGVWGADRTPLARLTPCLAQELVAQGVIAGGMIPKVESALAALAAGVGGIAIIDGHRPQALTIALSAPEQVGTLLVAD